MPTILAGENGAHPRECPPFWLAKMVASQRLPPIWPATMVPDPRMPTILAGQNGGCNGGTIGCETKEDFPRLKLRVGKRKWTFRVSSSPLVNDTVLSVSQAPRWEATKDFLHIKLWPGRRKPKIGFGDSSCFRKDGTSKAPLPTILAEENGGQPLCHRSGPQPCWQRTASRVRFGEEPRSPARDRQASRDSAASSRPPRGDPDACHPAERYGRPRRYAEQGRSLFCRVRQPDGTYVDTCRTWNNGHCRADAHCPNKRLHLCSFCLLPGHRRMDCEMQTRARVPDEYEARQATDRRSVSRRR
jgi:hypothetical protein